MRRRRFLASLLASSLPAAPYVQNVSATGATVCWPGPPESFECPAPASITARNGRCEARLSGLESGRRYTFSAGGVEGSFRTASTAPATFLVFGDSGTGSDEQRALAAHICREDPAFVLHMGDIAYPSGFDWVYRDSYLGVYAPLMRRAPFFPAPGNHDYYDTNAEPYFDFHDFPSNPAAGRYYAFEWAGATFVSIDSNAPLEDPARRPAMLAWLDRTLAASPHFWRIVYFHHPPFAAGPNQADVLSALVREFIVPILDRHRVPLIFSGHEHSYQRTRPLGPGQSLYVTSGGGGAATYPVGDSPDIAAGAGVHHYLRASLDGYRFACEAIGLDGLPFDRFELRPRPLLAPGGAVNAASFSPRIGRASAVSLFGTQLGLPQDESVTVTVNGSPARLLAVTPGQVNFVLPPQAAGRAEVTLTTPNGAASLEIEVLPAAPGLFPVVDRSPAGLRVFATGLAAPGLDVIAWLNGRPSPARIEASAIPGVQTVDFPAPAAASGELSITANGERSNSIRL